MRLSPCSHVPLLGGTLEGQVGPQRRGRPSSRPGHSVCGTWAAVPQLRPFPPGGSAGPRGDPGQNGESCNLSLKAVISLKEFMRRARNQCSYQRLNVASETEDGALRMTASVTAQVCCGFSIIKAWDVSENFGVPFNLKPSGRILLEDPN